MEKETSTATKETKTEVDYSKGMRSAHCGICEFYRDYECTKVKGIIRPEMWCKRFKKK